MAITDNTKLDTLWKKIIFGVTETDVNNKEGPNESVPSSLFVRNSDILSQSDQIPSPAPTVSNGIVSVNTGSERIKCREDPSVAGSRTWFAVVDFSIARNTEVSPGVSNELIDWIPPSIDASYLIKVFAGDPLTTGVPLNSLIPNEEWIFDYQAGVLHFSNNVPTEAISNGIFVEGFRYVGMKGIGIGEGGLQESFIFTTSLLNDSSFEEFTLSTGNFAVILDTLLDTPCVIEAHGTPTRTDTNPYTFRAIPGRLFDDGSFIQSDKRFFGPRHAFISSRDSSGLTYWRIINESGSAAVITLTLNTIRI